MKKVLLIAGGGTLGTYTAEELIRLGYSVDIICLEEKASQNERLKFYKAEASIEFLIKLFKENHYDGIVNFIHYPDIEEYKPVHKLLTDNTEHLIFLSSYRVYADMEHPITENAPLLLDISDDKEFLENEKYAISKARAEKFIRDESNTRNWTVVRPVISFSQSRFDIVTISERVVLENEKVYLPEGVKNVMAGLDWSGNSGKLIANLLFKKEAFGESYTISSAQNLTWGEIADIYTELVGTKFEWIDTNEWLSDDNYIKNSYWAAVYDRFFDRTIDNSKVLKATGLNQKDFKSIKEGLKIELTKMSC